MRSRVYVLMCLALAVSAVSARAVGKVTVDPNVRDAGAIASARDADTRLDQKVSVDARRHTVSEILAELTKSTGVTLCAGYNNLDWQVRDRRMSIFAQDVPIRSLMDSIACVMKFKWSRREADGTWTYRLYMDRTTLLGAERQRLIEENRLRELEDKQRERVLDDLTKANAMSDDELESLRDSDPMLYVYTKIGWTALLPDLFVKAPRAKEAWTEGDLLTLQCSDMSPEARGVVTRALQVMDGFFRKDNGSSPIPADVSEHIDGVKVVLNSAKNKMGYRGDSCIGDVTVFWSGGAINTGFINPDSPVADITGRAYIRAIDGEAPGPEIRNETIMRSLQEQKTDFGEPIVEHPDDAALACKVRLRPMGDGLADLLRAVSKASGYAVVSDSFASAYKDFDAVDTEIPLQDALDKMASQYRYNWDRRGSVLEFRDRDWFRKRASQVPEAWLDRWRKTLKNTGTLDIDELGRMSQLDDEQAFENLYSDDVLNASDLQDVLATYRDMLRAYECLNDRQQAAAFSDAGLGLALTTPSQWRTIEKVFRSKPLFDAGSDSGITLRFSRSQEQKQLRYFVVAVDAGANSAKWDFTTPHYELSKEIAALPLAGEKKRAVELFEEARQARLSDTQAWFHLGWLLYDAASYEEALQAFDRVAVLGAEQPVLRFAGLVWQGQIFDLIGRRSDALHMYQEALAIDIGDQRSVYNYDMVIDHKYVEERLKIPFERK